MAWRAGSAHVYPARRSARPVCSARVIPSPTGAFFLGPGDGDEAFVVAVVAAVPVADDDGEVVIAGVAQRGEAACGAGDDSGLGHAATPPVISRMWALSSQSTTSDRPRCWS